MVSPDLSCLWEDSSVCVCVWCFVSDCVSARERELVFKIHFNYEEIIDSHAIVRNGRGRSLIHTLYLVSPVKTSCRLGKETQERVDLGITKADFMLMLIASTIL